MKIAAIIQAHHRPDLLEKLLDRLSGDLWTRHVHVDRKSDIAAFAALRDRAAFLEDRVIVRWSGFSQVQATLRLLEAALAAPDVTHLYLMSGQDYPLKSDAEIAALLHRSAAAQGGNGGNFMNIFAMPRPDKPISRLQGHYFRDHPVPALVPVLERAARLLPPREIGRLLRGIPPHGGSTWWLVERRVAEGMLAFLRAEPWYARAFHHALFSDEMFFQTLFVHLGFRADGGTPTATRWQTGRPNPEIITPAIHAEMCRDWHLMARKFADFHPADAPFVAADAPFAAANAPVPPPMGALATHQGLPPPPG